MTFILRVFLPEVIVKFMRMVMGHFVFLKLSAFLELIFFLSPFLKLHKHLGVIYYFLPRQVSP